MNQSELELWIDNDEGLYLWWKRSKQSKRNFIKENRQELKELLGGRMTGGYKYKTYSASSRPAY